MTDKSSSPFATGHAFDSPDYIIGFFEEWIAHTKTSHLVPVTTLDCQVLEAAIKLLRTTPSETLCIPEGWKLVPMKATSAMVKAAIDYHYDVEQSEGMAGVYRIMINAAPQDDCHTSGRAQGQRSGKSLDQREAGLPAGAAPASEYRCKLCGLAADQMDDALCLRKPCPVEPGRGSR